MARCRLCGQNKDLAKSHIIPRFVYKWLRESSVTGHMRLAEEPDIRSQDGFKPHLLCNECEALFSIWEGQFASNIFHPTQNNEEVDPIYRKWMLKFAVSLSWRTLIYFYEIGLDHFSPKQLGDAEKALEIWKQFLKGELSHPGQFEQHMMIMGLIEDFGGFELPPNINRYILRTVDMDVVSRGEKESFVYTKMGKFVLFGFIEIEKKEDWKGTRLRVNRGSLRSENDRYQLPMWFNEHIARRANIVYEVQEKMSQRQHDKIGEAYKKNVDRFQSSEMMEAIDQDYLFFGEKAFYVPENED